MNHRCLLQSLLFIFGSLVFWEGCNFKPQDKSILEFPLPLNLKAVYWGSDVQYPIVGLAILDEMNFVIVGKGDDFLVDGDTVEVEKIIKLGLDKQMLLVKVEGTKSESFFIRYFKNENGKNEALDYSTYDSIHMLNEDSIKWIDTKEILGLLK